MRSFKSPTTTKYQFLILENFLTARLGLKIVVVTIKLFIKIKYNIIRYIQEIYENTLDNNIQIFWYIQKNDAVQKKF